jgi:hypothetical protein
MNRILALCAAGLAAAALTAGADKPDWKAQEKDEIRQTLHFADPARPGQVVVDDVWGSIEVEGADVREVELVARKTIRAKSEDRLARAKDEVKLEIRENAPDIEIFVDGPFRCNDRGGRGLRFRRDPGYEVQYDFTLRVPRTAGLVLDTVLDGDIRVRNIEGAFEVHNVNGRVELEGMGGAGEAETVNGGVRVAFRRAPAADCAFKTINGKVDLTFPEAPAADFKLKTFNGEAWSDFPVEPLPPAPVKGERKDGRFVYKSGGFTGVRSGRGGVAVQIETLNGGIYLHAAK